MTGIFFTQKSERWPQGQIPTAIICVVVVGLMTACTAEQSRPEKPTINQSIQQIVQQPEYQQARPGLLKKILDRVWEWLRWLVGDWWVGTASGLLKTAPVLYWVIVIALLGVGALLLYHLMSIAVNAFREREPAEGPLLAVDVETPQDVREQAQRLAEAGEYRSSLERLFEAVMLLLDWKGVVGADSSRTNQEYARAVADQAPLSGPMHWLAGIMDRVLYGHESCGREDYRAAVERANRVWRIVEESE